MEHHEQQRSVIVSKQRSPLSLTSRDVLIQQCAQGTKIKSINGRSIGSKMSDLVKRITVITGLKTDESSADMFAEEICKFLLCHYGNLTIDEVVAAFSINATESGDEKVIFYGGYLTIEHIGQVLTAYKSKRAATHRKLSEPPPVVERNPTKEEIDMQDKQLVNGLYAHYLAGDMTEPRLAYCWMAYDVIKAKRPDLIPPEPVRNRFYHLAKEHRKEQLLLPNKDKQERDKAKMLLQDFLSDSLSFGEEQIIINDGKRRTLLYIFERLSGHQIKSIL